MIPGVDIGKCRTPEILADAAYLILTSDATQVTGNFFIDDALLAERGDHRPRALQRDAGHEGPDSRLLRRLTPGRAAVRPSARWTTMGASPGRK